MPGNDFSLPSDLGWKCNDEISDLIDEWSDNLAKIAKVDDDINFNKGLWQVAKAQLMDNIYTVIKKYQEGQNNG